MSTGRRRALLPSLIHAVLRRALRLRADARASVLPIVGFAIIPIIAVIGCGLDIARGYTVQARLQQACDAASLAGRRAMVHDTVDSATLAETTKFFNFNFPQQMYGSSPFTPTVTRPKSGSVQVAAQTTVPTTVMQLFGYDTMPVSVSCLASQDFVNVDVVLVLDTTGSMNDKLSSGKKKIDALHDSVLDLYDTLKPMQDFLEAHGYRLRYAVVPYSQTVNIGRLLYTGSSNPNYVRTDAYPYARITNYKANGSDYDISWSSTPISHPTAWLDDTSKWNGCVEERKTVASAGTTPTMTEFAAMTDLDIATPPDTTKPETMWPPADPDPTLKSIGAAACPSAAVGLKAWTRADLDAYLSGLTPNGSTYLASGMVWGGRIASSTGVFGSNAPTVYNGAVVNKYVVFLTDGEMQPTAYSYDAYGAELMNRRIVGGTAPNPVVKAYAASSAMAADLTARHYARFDRVCQLVRNVEGMRGLWTIKLSDAAMDTHLRDCASTPDQAVSVKDEDGLNAIFTQIGQQITQLRISQ